MKIAIDISQIVHGTGVSFYTRQLVLSLLREDKENRYLLFGYSLRQLEILGQFLKEAQKINPKVEGRFFPFPPSLMEWVGNRFHWFPLELLVGGVDVYHSSDWIQFPASAFKVTTLHDFSFLSFPNFAHPKIKKVMKRRLGWVKKEADRLIAVSQATARMGVEKAGLKKEKMRVVYEAPGVMARPTRNASHNAAGRPTKGKMANKYGLTKRFFLAVANLDPRKNLPRIIEAFGQFSQKRPDWSLVVVGQAGWQELEAIKVPRVVLAGYVPEADLVAFYEQAEGLIYPSLEEGFGLPVLEAMRAGAPVLTSNLSSLPEVSGKAAVLVDPDSIEAIKDGMEKLVAQKEKLVKLGSVQVKKFSWAKAARETLKVYEEAKR